MTRHRVTLPFVVSAFLLAACQELPTTADPDLAPGFAKRGNGTEEAIRALLDETNVALALADAGYRAAMAEYITSSDSEHAGTTVLAKNVGNKQLGFDFVPHDPRREGWSGPADEENDDITYAIDRVDGAPPIGGLSAAETEAAIVRAMETWDALTCSTLPITRNPDFGVDIGWVAFFSGLGGSPFVLADVQHAGWGDVDFEGGVLGVTVTVVFIDEQGNPTDIDSNRKGDVAFREIYYDPSFPWADDGVSDVDVESVALHEAGHGLSQAHFGSVQIKDRGRNGLFLQASPRAVMNALYSSPFRELTGTDRGGHCSNWAQWPKN